MYRICVRYTRIASTCMTSSTQKQLSFVSPLFLSFWVRINSSLGLGVTNNVITSQVASGLLRGLFPGSNGIQAEIQSPSFDSLEPTYPCSKADTLRNNYTTGSGGQVWQQHLAAAAPLYDKLDRVSGIPRNDTAGWHVSFDQYVCSSLKLLEVINVQPISATTIIWVRSNVIASISLVVSMIPGCALLKTKCVRALLLPLHQVTNLRRVTGRYCLPAWQLGVLLPVPWRIRFCCLLSSSLRSVCSWTQVTPRRCHAGQIQTKICPQCMIASQTLIYLEGFTHIFIPFRSLMMGQSPLSLACSRSTLWYGRAWDQKWCSNFTKIRVISNITFVSCGLASRWRPLLHWAPWTWSRLRISLRVSFYVQTLSMSSFSYVTIIDIDSMIGSGSDLLQACNS